MRRGILREVTEYYIILECAMYVYMLSNERNTVLYTGVTNDLARRLYEHRHGITRGFTYRYNTKKLVYFEQIDGEIEAIAREKTIKGFRREKKNALIERMNPQWNDLSEQYEELRV